MEPVIQVRGLTKSFGALRAVDGLSFEVGVGELFGLVGPDGGGKTTTMRLLASILDATDGDAWVGGYHTGREAERVKGQIGYMSQRFGLYSDLTVLENLEFYADLQGVPTEARASRVERLLSFSNLAAFKKRLAGNLSGGMKQKLGLACALIHGPRILLLDEPTNGVDPVSRRDFWKILHQLLREKVTIVVSTSYLEEAERCSRVGLLEKGRLLALGAPVEVKGLMRGTILEVRCADSRRAAGLLRGRVRAESVGLFGDRVHIVTPVPVETERQVRATMREGGLVVDGIQAIEPGLEDVFVSMLAERGR